jgi:hypothetical protein
MTEPALTVRQPDLKALAVAVLGCLGTPPVIADLTAELMIRGDEGPTGVVDRPPGARPPPVVPARVPRRARPLFANVAGRVGGKARSPPDEVAPSEDSAATGHRDAEEENDHGRDREHPIDPSHARQRGARGVPARDGPRGLGEQGEVPVGRERDENEHEEHLRDQPRVLEPDVADVLEAGQDQEPDRDPRDRAGTQEHAGTGALAPGERRQEEVAPVEETADPHGGGEHVEPDDEDAYHRPTS